MPWRAVWQYIAEAAERNLGSMNLRPHLKSKPYLKWHGISSSSLWLPCNRRPQEDGEAQEGGPMPKEAAAQVVETGGHCFDMQGTPCPPLCCPIDCDEADIRIRKGSWEGHGAACQIRRAVSGTIIHL